MKTKSRAGRTLVAGAAAFMLCLPEAGLGGEPDIRNRDGDSANGRPRVGLVLGGGGARGAAHIGVLKELERLRVPVDIIVGTSIGAIVGGLYASGMSSGELENLVNRRDWAAAFDDKPNRSDLGFRSKQDEEEYPVRLELGLEDGRLQLPQGVIRGHQLDLMLRGLTSHSSHITNFDELEIPFRAVTADLVTGAPHVLSKGDLAIAMRASMSVPGVMAPVAIDGHLLADGGLVGNLGISVMQDLDVDVIIAVDVEFPLYAREQLTSAIAISEQVLTILIHNETRRQIDRLTEDDILIRPDLGELGSTDLAGSVAAIEPGVEATRQQAGRLRQLSLSDAQYSRHLAARFQAPPPQQTIEFIRVVDQDGEPRKSLERHLQLTPGDPVDTDRLAAEANRLFGLRAFEQVAYRLVEEGGRTGVEFKASSRTWGRSFLKFGLSIEDDFEGSTAFNFSTRLWQPGVNRHGAEWRADARIGTLPLLATEFYQPVGLDSRFFVAPRIRLSERNLDAFDADTAVARLRVSEAIAALDLGASLGNWGELRIGAYRGDGRARVKIGAPELPNLSFDIGGVAARLTADTFDDAHFPRNGVRGEILWDLSRRGLGARHDYEVLSIDVNRAWTRGAHTVIAGIDMQTSWDANDLVQAYRPLGGFLRLSGLERGEISGPHAGVARLIYYRRVGRSAGGFIDVPVYLGASIEAGNAWPSRDAIDLDSLSTNGSLFLGIDTYLGPMFLAAGIAERGNSNFYLFIGAIPD